MQWWIPIPPLRSSRLTQTLKPMQPRVALAPAIKTARDCNQADFQPSIRFEIKVALGGVGVFALHVW